MYFRPFKKGPQNPIVKLHLLKKATKTPTWADPQKTPHPPTPSRKLITHPFGDLPSYLWKEFRLKRTGFRKKLPVRGVFQFGVLFPQLQKHLPFII